MRGPPRQQGWTLLAAFLVLFMVGSVVVFARFNSSAARSAEQSSDATVAHKRLHDALINFVSVNHRLPCPADGTLAEGAAGEGEARDSGATAYTCTVPAGVVPWKTLGIPAADAYDAYGSRISYRVFAEGTQDRGASATGCDSVRAPKPVPKQHGVDTQKLCRSDHDTSLTQFLDGKGLRVTEDGTLVQGVAYVLIGHGATRAGAYNANGSRVAAPGSGSVEYPNTIAVAATDSYTKKAAYAAVAPGDNAYFDDEVSYLKLSELLSRAKVEGRDWPDPPAAVTENELTAQQVADAVTAAGGTITGNSTNLASLTIGTTTFTAGGGLEISTVPGASGYGIGIISASGTTGGSIGGSDVLTMTLPSTPTKAGRFAILLADFGSMSGYPEQAQLVFKDAGTTVATRTVDSCLAGPQLASYTFSFDPPVQFDSVELSANPRVGDPGGTTSRFLLSEIRACLATANVCITENTHSGNACP